MKCLYDKVANWISKKIVQRLITVVVLILIVLFTWYVVQALDYMSQVIELQDRSFIMIEDYYKAEILNKEQQIVELEEALVVLQGSEKWHSQSGIATAYSPYDNQNGIQSSGDPNCTSIGLKPGPSVIAVDPKRIPYGSDILIIYADGTYHTGQAGDTGGALRSSASLKVDIFTQTFKEAVAHGKQEVTILWKAP